MNKAETNKSLNQILYDWRKGRCTLSPIQQELLQYNKYWCSMKFNILNDIDAALCYDQILANMVAIASKRQGLSPNSNHLYTIFVGDSIPLPIHGTWQVSRNSHFNAFQQQAHGSTYKSYYRMMSVHKFTTGFINDCSMGVNSYCFQEQPDTAKFARMMSSDTQLWCNLLWAFGGKWELIKCLMYHIQNDQSISSTSSFSLDPSLLQIELTDLDNGQLVHFHKIVQSFSSWLTKQVVCNWIFMLHCFQWLPSFGYHYPNLLGAPLLWSAVLA